MTGALPHNARVIYQSERTVITRQGSKTGLCVITKLFKGPDAAARFQHEARILEHLRGVAGVVPLLSVGPGLCLTLRGHGGIALSGHKALAPAALLDLALQLARILSRVHQRGVLHLDISPANILSGGADGAPELIDFHLSTLAADERRGFTHHNEIAGTLAYIAPELTGRIGQMVDQRADLYSLGATLYELGTGVPPFARGDPLRMMRDLIATTPVRPDLLTAGMPPLLADIIMRLLEKEPDRRYQSADGLADDLEQLQMALAQGLPAIFQLGTTDFPLRLMAPSRLIAREAEITALLAAFSDAQEDSCRLLLITGPAGVGKSALVDRLRPVVTSQGGWFVVTKFEPSSHASATDPLWHLIRSVVALLLAEPEAELAVLREALCARLGADAGLLGAVVPEMAALISVTALPAGEAETRTNLAGLAFLRAVASASRPLVVVLDDLQWAGETGLRRIGGLLAAADFPGLLLVGTYRDEDVGSSHKLKIMLERWHGQGIVPRYVHLDNLPPAALTEMLRDMLRLAPEAARQLADAIGARTAGNPSDTLELLNGLRREKTLIRGATGWQWDATEIHRYVGETEMSGILQARIAALPAETLDHLINMACLGNDVAPALLAAATGKSPDELDAVLAPALADGLVVVEHGGAPTREKLRFRNKRVGHAIDEIVQAHGETARLIRHISLARHLAAGGTQDFAAATQYLAALAAIATTEEARRAADLLAAAAGAAARTFRHDAAAAYYAAAVALLQVLPAPDQHDITWLQTGQLTALYNLGRYHEGDRLFGEINQPRRAPLALAEATCVELLSLSNRGRHGEALAIGLDILDRLGIRRLAIDHDVELAEIRQGLAGLAGWLETEAKIPDAERACTNDPMIRATARLINRLLPSAQLFQPLTGAWLALQSQRLWATHGVCPELVANLARSAAAPNIFCEDYRTGYNMARYAVAEGMARGYEPETSLARQNLATFSVHWFERLENTAVLVHAANTGLTAAGEVQAACINYISSLAALFDCAPTLEDFSAELANARNYTNRTGNHQQFESFHNHLRMLQALTGEGDVLDRFNAVPEPALAMKPLGLFGFHCSHALIAILFGDRQRLAADTKAAMPLLSRIGGAYRCSIASLLRALSLAWDARESGTGNEGLADEFKTLRGWFAARAADAPANFGHLLHFIDAEAAWTIGDVNAGIREFDRALQYCQRQSRPWHHALIAERAGLFHLAHGLDYAGRALLGDARNRYAAWGAAAIARRLTATHGFLDAVDDRRVTASINQTARISADAMDLLAILRASQALSSQTTIGALHAGVVETLAAMTGATAVRMVLWDEQQCAWRLLSEPDKPSEPIEDAASRGIVPLSALRYAERTREPLVVDDARLDDRFARDPYFSDLPRCSLLVLPVQSQGTARAMLLLENHLTSGVFSQTRLNLVTLVAGQLAVSLDNAQLYASLERRVAERTEALAVANRQLEAQSIGDALTGLANRRRFDDMLSKEWLRALRSKSSIGLVMIDIDHFKRYNDRYGHVGGDGCLRCVATALQASTRHDVDVAARYGGEEFALILPNADSNFARAVAARAHAAVSSLRQPHAGSPFGYVTISLGSAALVPYPAAGPERLIELADAALYRAKQEGRNRVVSADAPMIVARRSV